MLHTCLVAEDGSADLAQLIADAYGFSDDVVKVITAPAPNPWRLREQRYRDALPGRMAEVAESLSDGLPEGMRFDWVAE